jgi:hypothetical protein
LKRLLLACFLIGCGRPAADVEQPSGPFYLSARSRYQDPGSDVLFKPVTQTGYGISRRCAQGPLTLELPAVGDPVGEYVWIELRGPRHVNGTWEAKYPDVKVGYHGSFTSGGKSENERCVAPDQAGGVPTGSTGSPGKPGDPTTPGGSIPAASGEVVTFTKAELPPWPYGKVGAQIVFRATARVGEKISIRIWSDTPQDWEGYVAWVEQGRLVPDDAAKWAAGQEAEKKKSAEASAAASAQIDRLNRCRSAWQTSKVWTPACEAEFPTLRQEDAAIDACWEVWNKQKIWTDECRKITNVDPSHEKPYGPPPAPPADPKPPQPSVHAEWVPGSYLAVGAKWVWSPGLWKVPNEDVSSGQTAKAPSAPPPPKVEAQPPKPSPNAVWCPGWWAFSLSGWIWIEGAWRIPPFPGATFRAYAWVSMGGVFTLVPGGWVKP